MVFSYDALVLSLGFRLATAREPPEPERSHAERSGGVGGGVHAVASSAWLILTIFDLIS